MTPKAAAAACRPSTPGSPAGAGEATPAVSRPLRVLCIEDSPDDELFIQLALRPLGRPLAWVAADEPAGVGSALDQGVDIVLCDYHLPSFSPAEALALLRARRLDVPLVVVTRAIGEAAAVEVLRAGAADYVSKDRLATLPMVVGRALAIAAQRREQQALLAALHEANERLRGLGAAFVHAQEAERGHIARELHDSLGQSLTALLMHLQAADRAADRATGERYRRAGRDILDQAIEQVKTLSFAMRPPQLDLLGLRSTIGLLCERMLDPAGIAYQISIRGEEPRPAPAALSVLYRVAQEALTNAVRHAAPRRVALRLRFSSRSLSVAVGDDGAGFDAARRSWPGQGLRGMAERCELAGGRLRLRSRRGSGTVVHARLPFVEAGACSR